MADEFCFSLLQTTTLQILQAAGFEAGHSKATHVLTNIFEQYLELLSKTASAYSHLSGRTTGNIYDCMDTLNELAIDLPTLQSWFTDEAKALIPSWSEQGDPSRILKDIVNGGLNRQHDITTYEYTDICSKNELSISEEEEEEEVSTNDEIGKNKENNLPDYVPPYFPPFPVMITPEENEESVLIETKTQLLTVSNDALPLPNIVKKKNKPVDNPFTYIKPIEESMLGTAEVDQPEALSLSMKIGLVNDQNTSLLPMVDENDTSTNTLKKRRRSETLSQLIDQIQYEVDEGETNKRQLTDEIKLFNSSTKEGAAPGNTMFSQESGLLDKLMTENAPPIVVPKLMAPNLLMDIFVPSGPAVPASSTTLRLNMTPTGSRKPSLGGITIEESGGSGSKTSTAAPTPTDLLSTDITPTTIKISPISLAALSSPVEEKKPKEKPAKEKKEKPPKEKKPKATKSKKKLTISLPKPQSDTILANNLDQPPTSQETTAENSSLISTTTNTADASEPSSSASATTTPVIRFTIKLPTEQKTGSTPLQSPRSASTSDVINCICENPTVDYGAFMVACDTCGVWFHGQCVGIAESDHVDEWYCNRCVTKK